jgi:hypothetical protein
MVSWSVTWRSQPSGRVPSSSAACASAVRTWHAAATCAQEVPVAQATHRVGQGGVEVIPCMVQLIKFRRRRPHPHAGTGPSPAVSTAAARADSCGLHNERAWTKIPAPRSARIPVPAVLPHRDNHVRPEWLCAPPFRGVPAPAGRGTNACVRQDQPVKSTKVSYYNVAGK